MGRRSGGTTDGRGQSGGTVPQYSLFLFNSLTIFLNNSKSQFQVYSKSIPSLFQVNSKSIPSLFQVYSKSIPSQFQVYSKSIPSQFQVYSKSIPSLFQVKIFGSTFKKGGNIYKIFIYYIKWQKLRQKL